jgi:hypothetical protein
MLANVVDFLSQHPLDSKDATSIAQWRESCQVSWDILAETFLTAQEAEQGRNILTTLLSAYEDLATLISTRSLQSGNQWPEAVRRATIHALLNRPQVEQRTENWYLEAAHMLTASQFSTILRPGLTRARLVMDKALANVDTSQRRTVVLTMELNPFTWGIRFEPVVKQLYNALCATRVEELGRLRHYEDPRLAASPDGLVVEGPPERLGRFVEFKAPVTRTITNQVPEDYMCQMQIQMEVGQVEECDYLEVRFTAPYKTFPEDLTSFRQMPEGGFWGHIFVIGQEETGKLLRYEYSPLKDMEWQPTLPQGESVVETVPWYTKTWYTTTVGRSRTWYASKQPLIESFWADVDAAKRGEFQLPVSNRKSKEPKCLITTDEESPPETAGV